MPDASTASLRNFTLWHLKGRALLPVVQGGMGIGISAHRLAGTVAQLGAMGTISSVDLRHHHPDLLAATDGSRDKAGLDQANLVALDREIRGALALAQDHGAIAVNVMKAVGAHAAYVRQTCESGAHAIVMGAGLPLDLPDMTKDFPGIALIPILSDARGSGIVLKKWLHKNRLPDAIVIEHPRYAGGHLGATRAEEINDPRFDFEPALTGVFNLLRELSIERERIPLIPPVASTVTKKCVHCSNWARRRCRSARRLPLPPKAMRTSTSSRCWRRRGRKTSSLS